MSSSSDYACPPANIVDWSGFATWLKSTDTFNNYTTDDQFEAYTKACKGLCDALDNGSNPDLTGIGLIFHYSAQALFTFLFSCIPFFLYPYLRERHERERSKKEQKQKKTPLEKVAKSVRLFTDFNVYGALIIVISSSVRLLQTPSAYEQNVVSVLIPFEVSMITCNIVSLLFNDTEWRNKSKCSVYVVYLAILNIINTLATYIPNYYNGSKLNFYETVNSLAEGCAKASNASFAILTESSLGSAIGLSRYQNFSSWQNVWGSWLCFLWVLFVGTGIGRWFARSAIKTTKTERIVKSTSRLMNLGGWYITITALAMVIVGTWYVYGDDESRTFDIISIAFWVAIGVPLLAFTVSVIRHLINDRRPLKTSTAANRTRQRAAGKGKLRYWIRLIWIPQLLAFFVAGPAFWIYIIVSLRKVQKQASPDNPDVEWGVGQIAALLAWVPFVIEIFLKGLQFYTKQILYRSNRDSEHPPEPHAKPLPTTTEISLPSYMDRDPERPAYATQRFVPEPRHISEFMNAAGASPRSDRGRYEALPSTH